MKTIQPFAPCVRALCAFIAAGAAFAAAGADDSYVGRLMPSEKSEYIDERTGAAVTVLTRSTADDNKIYQTHPNWLADGGHIVFVSNRTGENHLYALNEDSGAIIQLTDGAPVAQAELDRRSNAVFYPQGDYVIRADAGRIAGDALDGTPGPAESYETGRWRFPESWETRDLPTLDADGKSLYFCSRTRGSENDWFLGRLDLETGEWSRWLGVGFKPGHIQANPVIPGRIAFCHETGGDAPQRMWVLEPGARRALPFGSEGPDEWITHEIWLGASRMAHTLATPGGRPSGIGIVRWPDMRRETLLEGPWWHVAASPDQRWFAADTMDGELYLIDAARREARLLTAGHRPNRRVHAHQSVGPDGERILFASGRFGNMDLMTVEIPLWDGISAE